MSGFRYNTNNQMDSDDPRDALDNKKNFDLFANSTDHTYVDRFGVVRLTMRGALARYASVTAKGDWTTSTEYSQNDLWVDPATGIIYIVLNDYESGSSAEDDISGGHVAVYQDPNSNSPQLINKVIVDGEVSIDPETEKAVYIQLTEDITDFSISGGQTGYSTDITLYIEQDSVGYHSLVIPSNVSQASFQSELVGLAPRDLTIIKLRSIGAGWSWSVEEVKSPLAGAYSASPREQGFILPVFDENTVFNDEFTSTSGWTLSGVTVSQQSASVVRFSTTSNGTASKTVSTGFSSARDFIYYGKAKVRGSGGLCYVRITNTNTTVLASFGGDTTSADEPGSVYFGASISLVPEYKRVAISIDYENEFIEFAIHYDSNNNWASFYTRDGKGTSWLLGARVKTETFIPNKVEIGCKSTTGTQWIDVDYLSVCKPNIISIGDSICAGSPQFDPNPSFVPDRHNYLGSWQPHCNIYKEERNNLIVNKGIGAQTSTQIYSRFTTSVVNHGPRLVFLHCSTNDAYGLTGFKVSESTRTSNIQNCISLASAIGCSTVLLASIIGERELNSNTPFKIAQKYFKNWERNYLDSVTGHIGFIDICQAVREKFDDFMDKEFSADLIHPNSKGHRRIGKLIESLGRKS